MATSYLEATEYLRALLKETEAKDEEGSSFTESITDQEAFSDNDTDIDDQDYDELDSSLSSDSGTYIGTDRKTVWLKQKLKSAEISTPETCFPGPKGDAANVTDPISSWKILFDEALINQIVEHTNIQIGKLSENFKRERDCKKTDSREIYALIGLLYLGGVFKSSHTNVKDLWSADGTGISIFHTTMSYKRFLNLIRFISFDDLNSRDEREAVDNLTGIRNFFDKFITRCQEAYNIGKYITIDNMLVPFRGKCKFRQYIPKRKVKYGIKIFTLVDACTMYTWNMEVYDNKQPQGPYKVSNSPHDIVKRLVKPLCKSGNRNLTLDSWFTSYSLARELLSEDITVVGTVKKNKPEIPFQFKNANKRRVNSSLFGFREDATLVSYSHEKGKCTLALSTMHKDDTVVESGQNIMLPEILHFYNNTSGAVVTLEEMIACYSVNRITSKWPTVVFFALLNIAAINSRVILMSTTSPPLMYKSRRDFLKDLGLALVKDHIKYRSTLESLPRTLRMECAEIGGWSVEPRIECVAICGGSEEPSEAAPPLKKMKVPNKGRCSLCPRSADKKTKTVCFYCMRLVCHGHFRPVCQICAEGDLAQTEGDLPFMKC